MNKLHVSVAIIILKVLQKDIIFLSLEKSYIFKVLI